MIDRRLLITAVAGLGLMGCKPRTPKVDLKAQQDYLDAYAKQPGVQKTASGLLYKVLASGPAAGPHPAPQDEVKVNYEGRLIPTKDASGKETPGHIFDTTASDGTPRIFTVESLVPGWVEALQLMRPGDSWELVLPAKLGYGDRDMGEDIPPNSTLIFKMDLLDILPHPAPRGLA